MVDSHDLEMIESEGWWDLGTRAMHCSEMSFGMFGMRTGASCDGGGSVVAVVEFCSFILFNLSL